MTKQDNNRTQILISKTPSELSNLREAWDNLQVHPNVSYDFYNLINETRANIISPYVISISKNNQVVGIIAGRLQNDHFPITFGYKTIARFPIRLLVILHGGLMGEIDSESASIILKTLEGQMASGEFDIVSFKEIDISTPFFKSYLAQAKLLTIDRCIRIVTHRMFSLPDSYDIFMGSLASKTRYKLNAKRKKLEEDFPGKVIFKTYKEPDDISRACKDIESVAEKTYHRGLGVGFKDNLENRQRFMLFSKDGLLRIYLIYIDGQPVAYWVATLNNRNEIYLDFTGFDPNLKKYELGTMLFLHMLKDSIEGSVKLLDFGSGEAEYKERFGNSQIQEADYYLFSFSIKVLFINISHVISKTSENMIKKIIGDHKILKLIKSKWRSSVIK
jgi:hypothetical protein